MSTPSPVPAPQGQLVEIGEVAAANIVKRLRLDVGLPAAAAANIVAEVKNAIRDEINAMSSHFTLAVHDVQTQYEAETVRLKAESEAAVARLGVDYTKALAGIKSDFNWVKANKAKIAAVVSAMAVVAGLVGHFL